MSSETLSSSRGPPKARETLCRLKRDMGIENTS
jgi:hypothetical protein